MASNFQIRDVYNEKAVTGLAQRIKEAWREFEHQEFIRFINPNLSALTYSERSALITDGLEKYLPTDFNAAVVILLAAQLPPYQSDILENTNERFITVPTTTFISRNGLEHFDLSMHALYEMTKRLSSEWAIRVFLEKYPERSLTVLKKWAKDKNPHVRRLVSEGTRPFLPWGKRLNHFKDNPRVTIKLLNELQNDPSEYVRRSVANHLNDHAKNHPDLVVETLKVWKKNHPGKNMDRLIKHATRTLIKNGHQTALELIGFKKGAKINIKNFITDAEIKIGEQFNFSFDIISTSQEKQKVIIDYLIYFKKSDGSLSPKVFKLTTKTLNKKEKIPLTKKHSFRVITTRKYYAGLHKIGIQVNGEEKATREFMLTDQ